MPNAKVLESKKAVVEALSGKIKEATSIVFVDYKGINVAQVLGTFLAPISSLAFVLDQIRIQKDGGAPAEAAEA